MHWIETEKQKPPFNTGVIVFCRIYGRFLASYEQIEDDIKEGVWVNWMNGERGILPPTHWMFLPEAPSTQLVRVRDERYVKLRHGL